MLHKHLRTFPFLKTGKSNPKLTPELIHTQQAWKTVLIIRQIMKVSKPQKYELSSSLVNWKKFGSIAYANIQKSQYSITFINWENLWISTRETLTNPNFHFFCELGKNLRPTFKNPNFEFKDELKNSMFLITNIKWDWSYFKLHGWNN